MHRFFLFSFYVFPPRGDGEIVFPRFSPRPCDSTGVGRKLLYSRHGYLIITACVRRSRVETEVEADLRFPNFSGGAKNRFEGISKVSIITMCLRTILLIALERVLTKRVFNENEFSPEAYEIGLSICTRVHRDICKWYR